MQTQIFTPSASFTRPADITAYADGDLVANSTTAGSVVPLAFSIPEHAVIRRVEIQKTGTGVSNALFRVHLFRTAPTVANGDNGALSANNSANYIGAFAVTVDRVFSDGAVGGGAPLVGSEINVAEARQQLFALLEAKGAYTPGNAEVFTVTLEIQG